MLEIPLHFFLIIYIIFLGISGFFFVINILHFVGTGTFTRPIMFFTVILIAISLVVLEITAEVLLTVDLSQPLSFDLSAIGTSLTKGISQ